MEIDFIHNGVASGSVAQLLLNTNFNTNALRPYSLETGRLDRFGLPEYGGTYITVNEGGKPKPKLINNATTLLRKDDWLAIDRSVIEAAKPRLKLIQELRNRGLTYTIPDGMGKTVLQSATIGDISEAEISMNGVRESRRDRPEFDLVNLPLPIIHKDFSFYLREIQASRNGGSPLDTTTTALASRKVAELVEQLTLGTYGSYQFGGGTIYGLTNWPGRMTVELTEPGTTGWTGATFLRELGEMKQASHEAYHYGPWVLFTSPDFDIFLDEDFKDESDISLRERALKMRGLVGIETLDYLTGYQAVLVHLTPEVIRQVIGQEITTLQWELHGGMEIRFKVLTISVPQLRGDINGNTGIVHASADTGDLD